MTLSDLLKFLGKITEEDFVVVCIGNELKADDGIGPFIAKRAREFSKIFIDAGMAPENYFFMLYSIPQKIIIVIDAVDMGLKPGEVQILPLEKLTIQGISTHSLGIKEVFSLLEMNGKEIYFIGIQPKSVELEGKISDEVLKTAEEILNFFKEKCTN
ncbi:MAG: hydrogenase maturation protease [Elusimicrobia bacterium]|nr:hydrogenase maturation protease [Elusimicrobiota bacterium]